ncbi:hypothetical protein SASPL_113664 [Salvia splendens]|uniref:Uncharacterized protein n=1 Tax=Salvia splendens TaxID=180675 RepID=A0A8X8Y4G4_SALSN|nr:hypothetical protein SASPL_113664 [Salvia splendens]
MQAVSPQISVGKVGNHHQQAMVIELKDVDMDANPRQIIKTVRELALDDKMPTRRSTSHNVVPTLSWKDVLLRGKQGPGNVSTTRESEPLPSPSVPLDTPALAFEHILASLAHLEAKIEASEQRAVIVQPPPRPEPDPPYLDWQRGREDSTRHRAVLTTETGVSSQQQLGFGDGTASRSAFHVNPNGSSPWDREGGYGGGQPSRGFLHANPIGQPQGDHDGVWQSSRWLLHASPWDTGPPQWDCDREGGVGVGQSSRRLHHASPWDHANPTGPPQWDRDREGGVGDGQSSRGPHHVSPWDRDGSSGVGSRSRLHTAWDNPALRPENRSGRPVSAWDGAGGRHEGVGYADMPRFDQVHSDKPRYDHYRVEKLRYEKMRAPRFDGSDAANLQAIRVHVDEN